MAKQKVEVIPIKILSIRIPIAGITSILYNRMHEGIIKTLEDNEGGKAKPGRTPADPHAAYLASMHRNSKGKLGIPTSAFKLGCIYAAGTVQGITMKQVTGGMFVIADDGELVTLTKHSKPTMVTHVSRVGRWPNKVPKMVYRAAVATWATTLTVRYREDSLTMDQIVNLVNVAGFSAGVLDWRPQLKGVYGMYQVVVSKSGRSK